MYVIVNLSFFCYKKFLIKSNIMNILVSPLFLHLYSLFLFFVLFGLKIIQSIHY